MVKREHSSSPTQPGLDFIQDQENFIFVTDFPDFGDKSLVRNDRTAFSLDSLDVTGEPFMAVAGGSVPSVSADGTLVHLMGASGLFEMVWVDRDGTVGRKIHDGEREWIPYMIVVGAREMGSNRFLLRAREEEGQREMVFDSIVRKIRRRTGNFPYRPLPLPRELSQRPAFL